MKLKIIAAAAAAAAAALSLSSCKSQYEMLLNSNDVDLKYEAAFRYFNDAKFTKAADLFESISVLTGGTERDDTVQYYWGLSNYRAKDYYTAETNFEKFLESYPRSPFSAEARFLRLDCMYRSTLRYELDQAPTYRAIDAISQFMSEYPDASHADVCREMLNDLNARLDTKDIASRVSFRNVLKDDSENIYREDILYYIAMSSYKYAQLSVLQKQKERYMTFVDDYLNFIGEYPESEYRSELDTIYRRVQRILGRYPGQQAVGTDMEEHDGKAFEKERRRLDREQKAMERKGARLNGKDAEGEEDMVILGR